MADDSLEIIDSLHFHPCDSPRGMLYYNLEVLTAEQQLRLNRLKRNTIKENEHYLAMHPEVRALTMIIIRLLFRERPRTNVHELIARYFSRPKIDIEHEINEYVNSREPHVYEGDSGVFTRETAVIKTERRHVPETPSEPSKVESEEEIEEEIKEEEVAIEETTVKEREENIPLEILNEILNQAYKRLNIDVDRPTEEGVVEYMQELISEIIGKGLTDDVLEANAKKIEKKDGVAESLNIDEPQNTSETKD